jgi:hypothetical protein
LYREESVEGRSHVIVDTSPEKSAAEMINYDKLALSLGGGLSSPFLFLLFLPANVSEHK